MSKIVAVSPETLADHRWRHPTNYRFAAQSALVPLVAAEMAEAALALPLAFVPEGDGFRVVAVLGMASDQNLFVGDDGRWLAGYIPAGFRGYPFSFQTVPDGRAVLCVDMESGLIVGGHDPMGEPFFGDDGKPAKMLQSVVDFLSELEVSKRSVEAACASLIAHNLIAPWNITLQREDGQRKVEGLYRVDEEALNRLSDEKFIELRHSGAVQLAYCQLLSMRHISLLGQLLHDRTEAGARRQAVRQMTQSGDIDLSALTHGH